MTGPQTGYRGYISLGKEGARTLVIVAPYYSSLGMYAIVCFLFPRQFSVFLIPFNDLFHILCELSTLLGAVSGTAAGGKGKMRSNDFFFDETLYGYLGESVATVRLCGIDYESYQAPDALC